MKYLRRGSGYYIDVGAPDLVADGHVKPVHGQVGRLTAMPSSSRKGRSCRATWSCTRPGTAP